MFLSTLLPLRSPALSSVETSKLILFARHLSIGDDLGVGFGYPIRRPFLFLGAAGTLFVVPVRLLGVHGFILLQVATFAVAASVGGVVTIDHQLTLFLLLLHVLLGLLLDRERGELDGLRFEVKRRDDPVVDAVVPMRFGLELCHLSLFHNILNYFLVEFKVVFLLAELDKKILSVADILILQIL